ncbi:hypothetical protein RND81_07G125400 [Saponaria officinalis]|uniref:Uncharacterized protein n=1 Tax=Saponaria officinalis TaxID=3572 RepID=A0AAW1JS90_SAPOF
MDSRYELLNGVEEVKNAKMMIGDDQKKVFKYENGDDDDDKLNCFVVDLESVSSGLHNGHSTLSNTVTSNSRITLQRSLSRKLPQRDIEWKFNERNTLAPSSSPKAAQTMSTQEKAPHPTTLTMASQDNSMNNQLSQHQITIKTDDTSTIPECRWGRRSSFKRSPPSWFNDPKRILFIFATLSSMGTMLLIFLTLFMCKRIEKVGGVLDWQ